jgi:hypothetical protein
MIKRAMVRDFLTAVFKCALMKSFVAHGLGTGIRLDIGLQDLRRFHDDFPQEIMFLTTRSYYNDSNINGEIARNLIDEWLNPLTLAFSSTFPWATATMGNLRAAGRCFAINSPWVPDGYCAQGRPGIGTFDGNFNFGVLTDDYKLYNHLKDLLSNQAGLFHLDLNRASGDSLQKHAPLDFMLSDRSIFLMFLHGSQQNSVMLSRVVGVNMDCISFDFIQSGMVLLLNAFKKCIVPGKEFEFVQQILEEIG